MKPLLPPDEAQSRLLGLAGPVGLEVAPLAQAAGRWAAQDICALRTQPSADLSAMDGYAIRFADMPGPWEVIGESAAGRPFAGTVALGQAIRIFTGAPLPDGADTSSSRKRPRATVLVSRSPAKARRTIGRNVRRKGLDFSEGEPLIAPGERLTPARLAVAGTGGQAVLPVRRGKSASPSPPPATSSFRPARPVGDGQLPETNRLMLAAQLADLPVEIIDLGILPDRLDVLEAAFRAVHADLLVTTGGASVGDHDLVRPALEAAGARIDFWRIALRPGKPMMAGTLGMRWSSACPAIPSRPSSPPCSSSAR
jgi:molybdopterin molybdotransferase